jgi:nucleotide-binding universal stress UspA family protein
MTRQTGGDPSRPVIICYDGSIAAVEALEYAASVLPSPSVIVVSVWRAITEALVASGTAPPAGDPVQANEEAHRAAKAAALEGVERAQAAGLRAEALVLEADGPIWKAIETVAHERDALLTACGTARSGIKTVLPGDLAHALVQHSSRPVLVVPTRKAAAERRQQIEKD